MFGELLAPTYLRWLLDGFLRGVEAASPAEA